MMKHSLSPIRSSILMFTIQCQVKDGLETTYFSLSDAKPACYLTPIPDLPNKFRLLQVLLFSARRRHTRTDGENI